MPRSKSYSRVSSEDREEVTRYLEDRFGIPREVMDEMAFLDHGSSIFATTREMEELPGEVKVEFVGIRALRRERGGYKPTTDLILALGRYISKNVVAVREKDLKDFLARRPVKMGDEYGYVAVRGPKGRMLGCGFCKNGELMSMIPKQRTSLFP